MVPINNTLWIEPDAKAAARSNAVRSSYLIAVRLENANWLLINGLTGAIDLVNDCEYRMLIAGPSTDDSDGLSRALRNRGHILPPDAECEMARRLSDRIRSESLHGRMHIFLCPTNYCPMGCAYCIQGASPRRSRRSSLSADMVDAAFRAILRLCEEQSRELGQVLLFGGEPLQQYAFESILSILLRARQWKIPLFIFTSGLDLDFFAETLAEYRDVVTRVGVTLDGLAEYHDAKRAMPDAFSRAVRGIERLAENGVPVLIRSNVGSNGLDQVRQLRSFFEARGWWANPDFAFELAPLTNHGCHPGGEQEAPSHFTTARFFYDLLEEDASYRRFRFLGMFSYLAYPAAVLQLIQFHPDEFGPHVDVPRIHGCQANMLSTFAFSSDGAIHACNEQGGSNDTPAGAFWPELRLDAGRLQAWSERTIDSIAACRACAYRFFCGGGCPLTSFRTHDGDLLHPSCGTIKSDFEQFYQHVAGNILSKWKQ